LSDVRRREAARGKTRTRCVMKIAAYKTGAT
jgi:hypothetical protein